MPPMMPGMGGGQPQLPPELMAMMGQGGGMQPGGSGMGGGASGEAGLCPCCGQPFPQQFNTPGAPNHMMPQQGMAVPGGGMGSAPPASSSLMAALLGGGSEPSGGYQ
jgi:hypothetical protein